MEIYSDKQFYINQDFLPKSYYSLDLFLELISLFVRESLGMIELILLHFFTLDGSMYDQDSQTSNSVFDTLLDEARRLELVLIFGLNEH